MIRHVWERACAALSPERVAVAVDDERVLRSVESFGGRAISTSPQCQSGMDRVAEACRHLVSSGAEVEVVVNIQGDEPFLDPRAVRDLLELVSPVATGGQAPMATLARDLEEGEAEDPSVVKVVCDLAGHALYFSRAPLGAGRDERRHFVARAHVGLYAYTRPLLEKLASLSPTPLERAERLEQLRALEHRLPIAVGHTHWRAMGVDTPEDLKKARSQAC